MHSECFDSLGPYATSEPRARHRLQAALEALTVSLAREAGPWNVRCNAVRPGPMNNERLRRVLARVAEQRGVSAEALEAAQLLLRLYAQQRGNGRSGQDAAIPRF